jgi:hypothetical protein
MSTNKKIELWEGYEVEANEQLLDDFNFAQDLAEAQRANDLPEFISMIFAIVGGEKVYRDVEKHITDEKGYFSQASLLEIVEKIGEAFPKVGNRAQRRSWQTSK